MTTDEESDQSEPTRETLEARIAELERLLAVAQQPPPPLNFQALRLIEDRWGAGWLLRPSPAKRNWMTEEPFVYQCLPLVVANQWGWQVLCPTDVRATWNGNRDRSGLEIEVDPAHALTIKSQFGNGIITFSPPWLFRTSPGWDLYLKGPSNRWKANSFALDGVIETWWLNYTFTINWKIVEPGTVYFAKGESIGQLIPVPHSTFKNATATESPIEAAEPEAAAELMRWRAERRRRASEPVRTHSLYRKADNVEDHLVKVHVPEVIPTWKKSEE